MENNYYAIIPATVRYSKDLSPNSKLLYGELTALSNQEGYSWATNAYYAKLYQVEDRTIQRWLSQLKRLGFIKIYQVPTQDNLTQRRIFITDNPGDIKDTQGGDKKDTPPDDKKDAHNSTGKSSTKSTTHKGSRGGQLKKVKSSIRTYIEDDHKARTGQAYYWTAKDSGALASLIPKICFTLKAQGGQETGEAIIASAKALHIAVLRGGDAWQKNNISLTLLNSQYNQIISRYGSNNRATAFDAINELYKA